MSVYEAVEHLCGLQAQTTTSWYVGLWNRLDGFRPESVVDLIQARKLVRVVLMRSTIHLVTFSELGRRLQERWPDQDAASLAQVVRAHATLVQVPPRGLWGRSGLAAHTT